MNGSMTKNAFWFAAVILPLLSSSGLHGASRQETGRIENILLIMSDDLKASVLPAYGGATCRTPHIDRLAASGMVFMSTLIPCR